MKVSVVIPAKDVERLIGPLLDSLFRQVRRPDEVVIVDADSKDKTPEIIQGYIAKGYPVKIVKAEEALPGKARNIAIEHSANEIIAVIDGDGLADKNWLKELLKPLENDAAVDVVFGIYIPLLNTYFEKCQALVYLSHPQKVNNRYLYLGSFHSAAMRKRLIDKIGGFPEQLRAAEDLVFKRRIMEKRVKISYAPEAITYWRLNPDLPSMLKKIFIYTQERILNNINAGYIYWITIFYILCAVILVCRFRLAVAIFLISMLYRIIKGIKYQPAQIKKFLFNPLNWLSILFLLLVNDIARIFACFTGLIRKPLYGNSK